VSNALKIWLVEYGGALSANAGGEANRVSQGIQRRLQQWFQSVVMHAHARAGQPRGFQRAVQVAWASQLTAAQVSPYDLVIHFDASSVTGGSGATSPLLTPYNAASSALRDGSSAPRDGGQVTSLARAASGGLTRLIRIGDTIAPILSVVYVLYDAQFSNLDLRVDTNVEKLSISAFHEAAHNKDRSNSLHRDGGGGIFADIHTGAAQASRPNSRNATFFAERIWNWGPQYVVGMSMTPQQPPA